MPAISELATRTAELGRSEIVLVDNGETPQLAGSLDSGKADGKGLKERLEREKMLRLQEAEQYMAPRQDLVRLKPP